MLHSSQQPAVPSNGINNCQRCGFISSYFCGESRQRHAICFTVVNVSSRATANFRKKELQIYFRHMNDVVEDKSALSIHISMHVDIYNLNPGKNPY